MSQKYKSMSRGSSKEKSSVLTKFGSTQIVIASPKILLVFLLRKMNWLISKRPENLKIFIEWSENNIDNVLKIKKELEKHIDTLCKEYPNSITAKILGCENINETKSEYSYSTWYNRRIFVNEKIMKDYTLILADSNIDSLCDQISYRLEIIINKIDEFKITGYEKEVLNFLIEMNETLLTCI